ncbi:MAG: aspartate 1-decarboxylase [Eubacteriaceae bacterium]
MFITMLKSKLHRATITDANINYVGSITIDSNLMKQSDILPGEKVQVVNINNGARFETYTIEGKTNDGMICVNGAAARLVQKGDKIIIISYALMDKNEAKNYQPAICILNDSNEIIDIKHAEINKNME